MTELEVLIDMLDYDLELLVGEKNPDNSLQHKNVRVMLTLAQEIQALKPAQPPITNKGSDDE